MRRFALRLLPALLLTNLWAAHATADALEESEALAWLQRIAGAARELSYTGTFVYQHGDQVETSRITHFVDRSGEFEKLETLDGPKREIIRTDTEILTFFADTRTLRREKRSAQRTFPALLPEQLSSLTAYYRLRKGGHERIAGYDSQALVLAPRDEFRYGHKLWAEVKTGLLLKARMLNEHNEVVEQFHFAQVQINPPLTREAVKPSFQIPVQQAGSVTAPTALAADTGWTVRNQPAGFRKIMEMRRTKHNGEVRVSHLVYSDGLAAVSVFIEPLPAGHDFVEGLSHQGAVTIYTKPMADQLVTVLGETPPVTVMQFGDSVGPKDR